MSGHWEFWDADAAILKNSAIHNLCIQGGGSLPHILQKAYSPLVNARLGFPETSTAPQNPSANLLLLIHRKRMVLACGEGE